VNADILNSLLILTYLALGIISIALLGGWLLKRFGPPK